MLIFQTQLIVNCPSPNYRIPNQTILMTKDKKPDRWNEWIVSFRTIRTLAFMVRKYEYEYTTKSLSFRSSHRIRNKSIVGSWDNTNVHNKNLCSFVHVIK